MMSDLDRFAYVGHGEKRPTLDRATQIAHDELVQATEYDAKNATTEASRIEAERRLDDLRTLRLLRHVYNTESGRHLLFDSFGTFMSHVPSLRTNRAGTTEGTFRGTSVDQADASGKLPRVEAGRIFKLVIERTRRAALVKQRPRHTS